MKEEYTPKIVSTSQEKSVAAKAIYGHVEIVISDTVLLTNRAKFVCDLLKTSGIHHGKDGGEDSSGRFKFALATPEETVDRAVAMADHAFKRFEELGWVVQVPNLVQIDEIKLDKKEGDTK